ncbi:hypothetical protein PHG31p60 [Aeromonas phage 31]|uniref:Uncharacterized protein n=3 Tax=Biquartavirus TaxID=1912143 RepID=Q6U9P1_9CAUD|nr:hypothetical protein ST44RRORF061c [Aeromonas phage 44RR2.8t]YP_238789.1 hypothetical protein PHG31p60 [Aeromonas phage 31]UYD59623.1 hypothetical protein JNMOADIG_00094 [Aeromonas phage avDM5]UYD60403.1 hypothetical protein NPHMPGLK_00068 [Aeromonas phage avDM2]AAQ81380.1 hypothetical protein 44RRORF061c [Aeromonas phage 44RR2.8t]AAX63549.1 hypothetical protein PHG31p60 [Aeromonas phage 31]UYD60761.1 hypothetical protein NHNEHLNL_00165 [Aeromonas phage avDM2]
MEGYIVKNKFVRTDEESQSKEVEKENPKEAEE